MFCPRCHEPIEGPEIYICCANQPLEWRCQDCGKVSEGFAFPYGKCPMCNGQLEKLKQRDIDDIEALDAIRMAFEIELGGRAFYQEAAKSEVDAGLKTLFEKLAEMEEEHMETLARRYKTDIPESSPSSNVERAAIFAGIESKPDDPVNLLRIAVACEQRAATFFEGKSQSTPDESVERELYRELAAEEREHADMLTTELERFEAGKAGLL